MFGKFSLLFRVLQQGSELADKGFWKKNQAYTLPIIAGVLMAGIQLANTFGLNLPVDEATCTWIAGVLYALVNLWLTLATSSSVGIPFSSKAPEEPEVQQPVLYGIPESVKARAEEVVVEAVTEQVDDQLAKANEWLKRYSVK